MKQQGVLMMLLGSICGWPLQADAAWSSGSGSVLGPMGRQWPNAAGGPMQEGHALDESDWLARVSAAYAAAAAETINDWIASLAGVRWTDAQPTVTPQAYGAKTQSDANPSLVIEILKLDRAPTEDVFGTPGHPGQVSLRMIRPVRFGAVGPLAVIPQAVDLNGLLVPPTPTMEIPAPGAVLLGGLGVVLIGRLRRRRSL